MFLWWYSCSYDFQMISLILLWVYYAVLLVRRMLLWCSSCSLRFLIILFCFFRFSNVFHYLSCADLMTSSGSVCFLMTCFRFLWCCYDFLHVLMVIFWFIHVLMILWWCSSGAYDFLMSVFMSWIPYDFRCFLMKLLWYA